MKVKYNTKKYKGCLLCARNQQIQILFSALRDLGEVGSLHIESMKLILSDAPEYQRKDIETKTREAMGKLFKDLEKSSEVMNDIYV